MYNNKQVIVIIPARGGSKAIPKKNIRFLGDKPLVAHVITCAKKSKYVDKVIVSTDDTKIQFIAKQYGASVSFRSPELAKDDVPLDPVIFDAVTREEKKLMAEFDLVFTIQPTSPLLKTSTLDHAIEYLVSNDYDTVISAVDSRALRWGFDEDKGSFYPLYEERLNRQYLPKVFQETGAILGTKRKFVLENSRIGDKIGLIEVSREESVDIDYYEDWWVAEKILNKKRIILKTDASNIIGTGHVFRCLSLASKLTNHEIVFLLDENKPLGIDLVANQNYPIITHNGDEDIIEKILEFKPDIIINDILDTDVEYMEQLRDLDYFIINFEDIGPGTQYANLIFDALYEHEEKIDNLYSGPDYYMLRGEFYYHSFSHIQEDVNELLLTFGGTDPNNLTEKTLDAIIESGFDKSITVILGLGYSNKSGIKEKYKKNINVRILENVKNMSEYMANADLIFTSAGRTMYEVASLAVPCICMCQNEREMTHTFGCRENGFINMGLGADLEIEDIKKRFLEVLEDYSLRVELSDAMKKTDLKHGYENIMNILRITYKEFLKEKQVETDDELNFRF